MTSRRSSGSSRALSPVDPTRSANITVSWRRSATGAVDGGGATCGMSVEVAPNGAPQSPQKRFPGGFSLPHALHRQASGEPQSPQNFLPCATIAPQPEQIIRYPSGQTAPSPDTARRCCRVPPGSRRWSRQLIVFPADCFLNEGLRTRIPVARAALVTDIQRDRDAAMDVAFVGRLMEGDFLRSFDELTLLAKVANAPALFDRHAGPGPIYFVCDLPLLDAPF